MVYNLGNVDADSIPTDKSKYFSRYYVNLNGRALTDSDIAKGLDPDPNPSINIHWSGIGTANFSAGCQVIAGESYINDQGKLVNCSGFAATSYGELGHKTRGAYNVLTDLLLSYSPAGVRTITYTLGRDETLRLSDVWKEDQIKEIVDQLRRP